MSRRLLISKVLDSKTDTNKLLILTLKTEGTTLHINVLVGPKEAHNYLLAVLAATNAFSVVYVNKVKYYSPYANQPKLALIARTRMFIECVEAIPETYRPKYLMYVIYRYIRKLNYVTTNSLTC